MVETQFNTILEVLEPYFSCKISADENDSCLINLKNGLQIQIELTRQGLLLIACKIGTLQHQRLQEIFQTALIFNGQSPFEAGSFGFSVKTSELILFKQCEPTQLINIDIKKFMDPFIERALMWTNELSQNQIPSLNSEATASTANRLFGL